MLQPIWARQSALKESGLLLGVLNLALAVICTITFFGVLALTFILSAWLQSFTGNPRALAPFPVPVLLVLYAVAFVVMWVRFAKGLQPRSTSRAVRTGLVGAIPLLGLALLGYMGVVWILLTGDFGPDSMLEATVVVYGVLSTLILFAGVACMVTTALLTPRPHS